MKLTQQGKIRRRPGCWRTATNDEWGGLSALGAGRGDVSWGVAPGWDGSGPLALQPGAGKRSKPKGIKVNQTESNHVFYLWYLHTATTAWVTRMGEVRGTSVLPPSRRLLQAQVAGAVLAAVKTINSHRFPSNPKVYEPKKLCEPHGQSRRHRGLCSRPTGRGQQAEKQLN